MAENTTTNTITTATMQPQPKLDVPVTKPDMTPYDSIINGAITSLPSVTGQVTSAQKTTDNLLAGIASTGSEIANKEVYSQGQQDLAGVKARQAELDALDAQFTDIGAQMKGLVREKAIIPEKVQLANKGTGASDIGVAPQEADALRINAIKALDLASQSDILGAQVTNAERRVARAKENAQLAVDLKYKPEEAKLAQMKELLDLNTKYILDPAEKKRVEATNIALNERTRLLAEKKQDEKDNTELIVNASSQGAPASMLTNAKNMLAKGAKPADVASYLGVYAGDYIGNQAKLKDMKMKDLEYKIKVAGFNLSQTPAIGQNLDGTVVKGSGPSATDRNINTVEQIIKKNNTAIGASDQTLIGNANQVIKSIQELAKTNPEGKFEGMYPLAGLVHAIQPDIFKSDKTVANKTALGAIELKVQLWASGASLTKAQTDLVQGMTPQEGDTDNVAKEKLKRLTDYMNLDIAGRLSANGIKYQPETSDYFDKSIATRVKNAVGTGYSATDVVEGLMTDPVYGEKMKLLRSKNVPDEQIVTYLQTLKETETTPVNTAGNMYK